MRRPSISHSYGVIGTSCLRVREETAARRRPNKFVRRTSSSQSTLCTMITMQLTCPDLLKRRAPGRSSAALEPDGKSSSILPIDQPASVTTSFQPLDPGIVNETIPAFFIGRNKDGFWLARDVRGKLGGIFLFESSALSFARRNSRPSGCATIFPSEKFELDLENQGNPLIVHLGPLVRLVMRGWQRMAAIVGKLTIERPTRFFDGL